MKSRIGLAALAGVVALVASACVGDSVMYRADMGGTSFFGDSTIGPSASSDRAVSALTQQWKHTWNDAALKCWTTGSPPYGDFSTPAVWAGTHTMFTGLVSGCFVALDTQTGALKWRRNFGYQPSLTCSPALGNVASPTLQQEGSGASQQLYVYVHSPDGYLRKLRATDGGDVWATAADPPLDTSVNDYFAWGSPLPLPTLGLVVVGVSSNCDQPFARGGLKAFNMTTGKLVWTAWTEPANPSNPRQWDVGAGVWTGLSSDGTAVYASTGSVTGCNTDGSPVDAGLHNPKPIPGVFDGVWHLCDPPGDQYSIVKVDAKTGNKLATWHAPTPLGVGDPDFGSGTTLWHATIGGKSVQLVGACNKNGTFYAVNTSTMQLAWSVKIGDATPDGDVGCLSGAVADQGHGRLYLAGNHITTTAGNTTVSGRVRSVNPATGATIWEQPLPSNALGTGALNGNGVLAYAGMHWGTQQQTTWPDNGIFLLDANNGGKVLRVLKDRTVDQTKCPTYPTSVESQLCTYEQFPQPVFADGGIWMDNQNGITWYK